MASSDEILLLIRRALDEFDDRPAEVSIRRVVRIASLVGDTESAVRFGYELKTFGGSRSANKFDTQNLMADPNQWGSTTGPAEQALRQWMADRAIDRNDPKSNVDTRSIGEIERMQDELTRILQAPGASGAILEAWAKNNELIARTKHRAFSRLCGWERQFGYASINQSIFQRYQVQVDRMLADGAPELLAQFTAVYKRMQEAAQSTPDAPATEELSQAITSCRRVLKATVDHVFPPQSEPSETGHPLNDSKTRHRLFEFIKRASQSSTQADLIKALGSGLHDRFTAVDTATNKGVHAEMALELANLCALNTYIVCGEVLRLKVAVAVSDV